VTRTAGRGRPSDGFSILQTVGRFREARQRSAVLRACLVAVVAATCVTAADAARANRIRQPRIAGCTLFDFARPGSRVPGTQQRYDRTGFWHDPATGNSPNGLYDTSNGWSRQQGALDRIVVDPKVKMVRGMSTIRLAVAAGDRIDGMPGGERADVQYAGPNGIAEGKSQWWAWSTRTAVSYRPSNWEALMDFHSTDGGLGANVVISVTGAGHMLMLSVTGGDRPNPSSMPDPLWRTLSKFVPGRRYDFEMGVGWSSDPRAGWVEVWLNGVRVVRRTHVATLWRGLSAYPKLANYRFAGVANWTNVVYDAGFRRAASRPVVHSCLRHLRNR
jgi:hypothetical protein